MQMIRGSKSMIKGVKSVIGGKVMIGIKSMIRGKVNAVLSVCVWAESVCVWQSLCVCGCVAESVAHNYLKPQVHQHLMR